MRQNVLIFLGTWGLLSLGLGVGLLYASWVMAPTYSDPFLQRNFPCQEDEVLGYAPQFGSERVGCFHLEKE